LVSEVECVGMLLFSMDFDALLPEKTLQSSSFVRSGWFAKGSLAWFVGFATVAQKFSSRC